MAQETVDYSNRPSGELIAELEKTADRVEQMIGNPVYPDSLMSATGYRFASLYADKLNELREARWEEIVGKDIPDEEKEQLRAQMAAEFDPFSTFHLTETLRYQHDRAIRDGWLQASAFPAQETPSYEQISGEMGIFG